jgi:imidazole glycerol-phosphate synthase subunit HisH
MPTTALIDYGAGNLASAARALCAVGADVRVTDDPGVIAAADRIVLPGQGAFDQCMGALLAKPGLKDALEGAVLHKARPFLGICVGMQLLAQTGLEHGEHSGLSWIGGVCAPLATDARLPHMGWNRVTPTKPHPVLAPIGLGAHVYFAHSFALNAPAENVIAACDHGAPFTAAVARDTIVGVQFHPEKSQAVGLAILKAFVEWRP